MKTKNNLQSMEKLLEICTGLGDKYQPGNQKLQVEAMTTLLSQAQTMNSTWMTAHVRMANATDQRGQEFNTVQGLATRILGALVASGASAPVIDNARAIVRRLQGAPIVNRLEVAPVATTTSATVVTPPATKRRARGLDYGSVANNFEKLISTLTAEPRYRPSESDLRITALNDKLSALQSSNRGVMQASEALRQTRNEYHDLLYNPTTSVYQVGKLVKQYVKSVYGFNNENHKAVRKIKFTKQP